MNILFVCSKNRWRSPTAERVYRNHPAVQAKSAGTSRSAKHQATAADIRWADAVFAMQDKHLSRLRADHPQQLARKNCYVLDIPDNYRFMDPRLVAEIKQAVDPIIDASDD